MEQQNEVAGVQHGEPMTREKANEGRPNPDFALERGYRENCTACVVAYEARLRGYDIEAMSRTGNDKITELMYAPYKAWFDTETKDTPNPTRIPFETPEELKQRLVQKIERGSRYTFRFELKGEEIRHIISADKDERGFLRLYDPQNGITLTGDSTLVYLNIAATAEILRIDNKLFSLDIVNHILRKARP